MNPKKNTVAVTFRCDVAVADQLDELCRMMGIIVVFLHVFSPFFYFIITTENFF